VKADLDSVSNSKEIDPMNHKSSLRHTVFGRDLFKMVLIGIGVALIVPLIETLLGRPTRADGAKSGNPHTKPPFDTEEMKTPRVYD
jgi:hypothetical protein